MNNLGKVVTAFAIGLAGPLTANAQSLTCPVDVVFTVDTSGSMFDEAAALCSTIVDVQGELQNQGINANSTLWAIDDTTFPIGAQFPCLSGSAFGQLPGPVPGSTTCVPDFSNLESWGLSTAKVANQFPWTSGAVRIVVPISDEGACNGNSGLLSADDSAVANAVSIANANNVFVSPVAGTGSAPFVDTQMMTLASGTMGTFFQSTDPNLDLAQAVEDLVVNACVAALGCQVTPQFDVNRLGDTHTVTAMVTEFDGTGFVPVAGRSITITVDSGPNAGQTVTGVSNAQGEVTFSYTGNVAGVDVIGATCDDAQGDPQPAANPGKKFWGDDCNDNGIPDTCDVDCNGFGGECGDFADCGLSVDVNGDNRPDECSCILGTQSVRFADRASTSDVVASYGTTELGVDATSGTIDSSGKVTLRNNATVNGDVTSGGSLVTQLGASVTGTTTENGTPALPAIPVVGGPGFVNGNLVVDSGSTTVLTPGTYGAVIVNSNATLELDGSGEYGFKSLIVDTGATLEYDAGSTLFVHQSFTWRGTQSGTGPLPFGQTGTGWTHFESAWDGQIVAPDANVRLAGNGGPTYTGAQFVGKQLLVETDTTVICQ